MCTNIACIISKLAYSTRLNKHTVAHKKLRLLKLIVDPQKCDLGLGFRSFQVPVLARPQALCSACLALGVRVRTTAKALKLSRETV